MKCIPFVLVLKIFLRSPLASSEILLLEVFNTDRENCKMALCAIPPNPSVRHIILFPILGSLSCCFTCKLRVTSCNGMCLFLAFIAQCSIPLFFWFLIGYLTRAWQMRVRICDLFSEIKITAAFELLLCAVVKKCVAKEVFLQSIWLLH